jgi:hypothetical protein
MGRGSCCLGCGRLVVVVSVVICSALAFCYLPPSLLVGARKKAMSILTGNTTNLHRDRQTAMAETTPDAPISFKKPLRLRNEHSEQRRHALKEYYRLKQQQQQQQQHKEDHLDHAELESDDEALAGEILQDKPIEEPDITTAEFKEILQHTNKLTSSVNLINASIKDIIYNNYYELIKLNDYLEEYNELDSAVYKENLESAKDSVQELLHYKDAPNSVNGDEEGDALARLNKVMDKIVEFDQIDFNKKIKTHDQQITGTLNALIAPDISSGDTKLQLTKLLNQVKKANGEQSLIIQLETLLQGFLTTTT